jgi:hypothetical protein
MMIQSKRYNHLSLINNHLAFGGIFTTVERSLQIRPFCTNKPNFRKSQINVSKVLTKDYDNKTLSGHGKNKPNTNPIQTQYKPNTNPIQTQYKPNTNPIQTQYKANQSQNKPKTNPISRWNPDKIL